MEDSLGYALSGLIFGALAVMAVYMATMQARDHKRLRKAAEIRSWDYKAFTKTVNVVIGETSNTPERSVLYRIQGKLVDASPWQIETRFRHTRGEDSTSTEESTFWQTGPGTGQNLYIHITPKVNLGVTVLGGDKEAEIDKISLEQGKYSLQRELRRFGVDISREDLESVHRSQEGVEDWYMKFNLFTTDDDFARRLIDGDLQSALLDWTLQYRQRSRWPSVTICPEGTQVTLQWTVKKVNILDKLVVLGQAVVGAFKAAR